MTVLVTGTGGFVGRALVSALTVRGLSVRGAGRDVVGDIGPDTDWRPVLDGVETVVHLAARVHVMRDDAPDPLAEYRRVNLEGTRGLAAAAADRGVGRFVFLSSVKVNGEAAERPFGAGDPADPKDAYGTSKWEAEQAIAETAGSMEVVVLRPPLVYGPGVGGNFLRLLRLVDSATPLPLGGIRNLRSLIYLGNLVDAIRFSFEAPPGTYLPSDGEDLSTPNLVRRLAAALGRPARLVPVPVILLGLLGRMTGQSQAIARLTDSLRLDGRIPGWTPPFGVDEGLRATADWYREFGAAVA